MNPLDAFPKAIASDFWKAHLIAIGQVFDVEAARTADSVREPGPGADFNGLEFTVPVIPHELHRPVARVFHGTEDIDGHFGNAWLKQAFRHT